METTLATLEESLRHEFGPLTRALAKQYFQPARFPDAATQELQALHQQGFVVHVMRTTSWINYLYLTWALIQRALPPVRAVVNLRPWIARPWRKTAQRGHFDVRFTYARRQGGSGLIFLKRSALTQPHGKQLKEDPFPALVSLARREEGTVFLVPELFLWERLSAKLKPSFWDYLLGSPEAPGLVHSIVVFLRNYRRAQFRMGEPINLKKFIEENPKDSDEVIARKVRGSLHVHLARETRAVVGPPLKTSERIIDETLRDRFLRKASDEVARESGRSLESIQKEVGKHVRSIASRQSPTGLAIAEVILDFVFSRMYNGMDVDEKGLERAMKATAKAPLLLCSSHKSHVDYLVLGWALIKRGYSVPLVAAGSNLSFFPLGPVLRHVAAYFMRRSFKGDKLYTASFKAYIRKLVHDGIPQEFFIEGGRSRTGKLLQPKLGLLTWEVEAVLERARNDLTIVPVSIDYEKVVESKSYRSELLGGEKKAETFGALLRTPKVLVSKYGRIHIGFGEPISLAAFMQERGLSVEAPVDEDAKRSMVRALGHKIMFSISRVSTVTPQALLSTAILGHPHRGVESSILTQRIELLRGIIADEGIPLSSTLKEATSDPTVEGPLQKALRAFSKDHLISMDVAKGALIVRADDERRTELSFYKNTLMNVLAARSLVCCAFLAQGATQAPYGDVKQRALWLSRLLKLEFLYRVGATFDQIFSDTVTKLVQGGLLERSQDSLTFVTERRGDLEFLSSLIQDYLESYLLAALPLKDLAEAGSLDRKAFTRIALETGRVEFLAGRLLKPESLSRPTLENALDYLIDRRILVENEKKLSLVAGANAGLAEQIRAFLLRPRA